VNGTGPEQQPDTESDTPLTTTLEKPNACNGEAGWRRGYAADCKALQKAGVVNATPPKSYQDRPGTPGERDTGLTLLPEDHRMRAEMAAQLAEAIADAHPDDACQIMTAALIDLSAGLPPAHPFVSAEEDAAWWASEAAPAQLVAVLAAVLKRLSDRALHLKMRKRLFMVLWRSFADADKRRFLDFAKGEV
jgi:hypothetical protein